MPEPRVNRELDSDPVGVSSERSGEPQGPCSGTPRLGAASCTLRGRSITLVPFQVTDIADRYLRWLNDPEVNQFLEIRFARQTSDTAREFVESFYGDTEKYMWGIRDAARHEAIGTATLYEINRHHGSAEFSLMIGERAYRGKDTAMEVIRLLAGFTFGTLGLRRLTGGSYATHYGMNFVFKRMGFRCEGRYLQAYRLQPGVYVDGYRWALLATEWKERERHER